MKVISKTQEHEIASVFIAESTDGRRLEFVESTQPPMDISKKWVIIVSTLFGCPVDCMFCDAGGDYKGKLTAQEILEQIDYMVNRRFNGPKIPVDMLKIQFARFLFRRKRSFSKPLGYSVSSGYLFEHLLGSCLDSNK